MWIFTKDALLMPAAVPMKLADKSYTLGTRTLQVRSRSREQLQAFIDAHPQMNASVVQETPEMDYEFRFYTTPEDFGIAIADSIAEIDYEKFKPEAKDDDYHNMLNRIWGVVYNATRPQHTGQLYPWPTGTREVIE